MKNIDHEHEGFLNTSTLRECVEKLELLKTPEERHRRLLEIPEVHADPKMNPEYESGGDDGEHNKKIKGLYHFVSSNSTVLLNPFFIFFEGGRDEEEIK